jgi:hypothetical protein
MPESKPNLWMQQMGRAKRPMPKLYKIVSKSLGDWVAKTPKGGQLIWSDHLPPHWFSIAEAEETIKEFAGINCELIPKPSRGGARYGAGRPKKSVNVNRVLVTLDDAEFAAYKANGEGNFLRYLIRKHQGLCMHVNQLNGQCSECGTKPAYQYEKM